ncbi:pentapeptide repeat-containing protein [Arsenophonus nasoniae]|uniref:E3 ubiquitin-protein ligase SopA n=1 Tax=Arsenophonus nasoniae TaxID=638 RepID=A0AA95K2Q9_9GAMM|nr:pentapeptide repeat-containing protein [Arsenophonus nasoniae]WGL94395.1 pentapeptide repeat-containing protein [Arsenophonus nasoniae]
MHVSPSKGANSVFRSMDTASEPLSDLAILRQAIPDDCSVDDKRDLQQQKRDILDKLIKQRQVGAELDLREIELKELDLTSVNLRSVNLERAKLQKANLAKACLSEANLQIANLSDATLKYARLANANLDYTNLTNAKLNMATLSHAQLHRSKLIKADLSYANLNHAELNIVELHEAILNNAKLMNANLQQVLFFKAELQQANFSNSNLQSSVFIEANLSDANLSNTKLYFVNFTKAKLNGADLTGANLAGAKLTEIALPDWSNSDCLDRYLNHINNNSSLLTTIDSIDAKYHDQKIVLVHKLIDSLNKCLTKVSLSSVVDPLLDTLAKAPYNQDLKISNWLNNNILPLYLAKYDTSMMPIPADPILATLLTYIENKPELMFSYNGAFIQLISQAMAGDSCHKEQAKTLYNHYLQDNRVEPYTKNLNFANYAGHADWSDNEANNFILLSAEQNSHYAMMISPDRLRSMLDVETKSNMIWNGFYLFQGGEVIPTERQDFSLTDLFNHHFKIFASNYQFHQQQAKFGKLLATLELGEFLSTFQTAITQGFSEKKLIDFSSQNKLTDIFNNKLEPYTENGVTGYRLTADYTQQLLQAYNLSTADKTTQAQTLLSLAAVFSKYSSSAIFGTETESPNVLRSFAFALMAQAYQLAPQIFASKKQYKDWGDRLLGYNNAFSCTAVLSTIMIEHLKAHFPSTLAGIMPPAWS